MSRFRRATALAAAALLLGTGTVAYADNFHVDGDVLTTTNETKVNLGQIACGESRSVEAGLELQKNGNNNSDDRFKAKTTVFFGGTADHPDVSVSMGKVSSVTLLDSWTGEGGGNVRVSPDNSTMTVTPSVSGSGTAKVTFTASGTRNRDEAAISLSKSVELTWVSGECPTNTAPSAPGAPVASSDVNQGAFSLTWDASTDAEDDALTYTLEGKDANDDDFSVIDLRLTDTEYTFAAGEPAEGTWVYQVKAVESDTMPPLESEYSGTSNPVVVDRTGPNAPTAAADRDAEYIDGTTSWWKDTVTVTFTKAGDPDLPDGSLGSGVTSVTPAETHTTHGDFSFTGTATDAADNVSEATTFSGNVDATAPTVVAPGAIFTQGSSATIDWTASDTGSGLATAASGSITVDTSTIGTHTVTIPAGTARDNVGPESEEVVVTYSVVYGFDGFFKPVDMGKMNVVNKAGSAIPLKFSLNGYQGMSVITSAKFRVLGAEESGDLVEEIATAGQSGLSYDADADQYVYVWKTDKAWAGKSGVLTVTLNDGTTHTVEFSFKK